MAGDRALPDPLQQTLLDAALATGDAAPAAWREFLARSNLDQLRQPESRLLPLVFKNLSGSGRGDPSLALPRRFQVQAWVRTQRLLNGTRPALQDLLEHGPEFRILKGGALAGAVYGDWACRPMGDLDLWVRQSDVAIAIGRLELHGFRSIYGPGRDLARLVDVTHSCAFLREDGAEIDLHWHPLHECCWPESDGELWRACENADVATLRVPVLAPTESLFVTLAHGYVSSLKGPHRQIYWVADALAILGRRAADVDWTRLLELARCRDLLAHVARALDYIARRHGASVPPDVLARAVAAQPSRIESIERRVCHVDNPRVRTLGLFACRFLRLRRDPRYRAPGGLLCYLRSAWDLESTRDVPAALVEKVLRNARLFLTDRRPSPRAYG